MRFSHLDQWLRWQESLHRTSVDLGLARCRRVVEALGWGPPPFPVISVAGTNGKGSSVAMLESVLAAAGYRTGTYTSPHLLRYNERVRIAGREAADADLCAAFGRLDAARGDTTLTYFEFGTLTAMDLFRRGGVDVAVMEVGVGGRLDAVNVFDADVALVTTIDMDHQHWLGKDRDSIGAEKAGIFRRGRDAVCADPAAPASVLRCARDTGARLWLAGRDYRWHRAGESWRWQGEGAALERLPLPGLNGDFQVDNAASVIMVLERLQDRLPVGGNALREGLRSVRLPARFQVLGTAPERILDVAHNEQAARSLAQMLLVRPCEGRTLGVAAMLGDKDVEGVLKAVSPAIDTWYVGGLDTPRAAPVEQLGQIVEEITGAPPAGSDPDLAIAYRRAVDEAGKRDRVVVFGSFYTAEVVLRLET